MSTTREWFYELDKDLDQKISSFELRLAVYLLGVYLTPQETQKLRFVMARGRYGVMDEPMFTSFFPDGDRTAAERFLLLQIDRHVKRLPNLSVTFAFFLLFLFAGIVMLFASTNARLRFGGVIVIICSAAAALNDVFYQFYMRKKILKLRTTREIPSELRSTLN